MRRTAQDWGADNANTAVCNDKQFPFCVRKPLAKLCAKFRLPRQGLTVGKACIQVMVSFLELPTF